MTALPDLAVAYLHVGVVQISVANLVVIAAMIVMFILALVLPFPDGRNDSRENDRDNR